MSCFHIDRLFSKADGGTKKDVFFSLTCEDDAWFIMYLLVNSPCDIYHACHLFSDARQ